jgi:hypothetical protein
MTTKDEDLVQEVFKTMLQPRETGLGSKRGLRRLRIESVEREDENELKVERESESR